MEVGVGFDPVDHDDAVGFVSILIEVDGQADRVGAQHHGFRYWELAGLGYHAHQLIGGTMLLGCGVELLVAQHREGLHLFYDLPHVLDGVHHVAGTGFALGANHGRAFGDAPQGLAQIARSADKGSGEGVLVDVMELVGRGEDFALVDEVDSQMLQDLGFGKVPDTRLGHDRDGDCADNLLNQARLGHARHSALGADHRRHPFQRHDRGSAGPLGDDGLFGAHHVHDDAALKHLSQTQLQPQCCSARVGSVCLCHLSASSILPTGRMCLLLIFDRSSLKFSRLRAFE